MTDVCVAPASDPGAAHDWLWLRRVFSTRPGRRGRGLRRRREAGELWRTGWARAGVGGGRGSTAVVSSRALGDCLRAGRDVGGRDRKKWEPLTGHDARDVLRDARPRALAPRVRCPVCLDTLVPPRPGPLACWVPGSPCWVAARRRKRRPWGAPSRSADVAGALRGAGRVASTWLGHPAPANCRVSVPFAPCPARRTVPGWPAEELCWMQFGDPWASARATLPLLALRCEVQSYNVYFTPPGQVPN